MIRLSGLNIVIDDTDHPLIIKVASIQAARMQVYFIDNDDFFHKRLMLTDEAGNEYEDNAERAIFYARGVLETLKKLRWSPDIIYCQGWMSAIVPLYIKTAYREESPFLNSKVIFSAFNEMPKAAPATNLKDCLVFRNAKANILEETGIDFTKPEAIGQLAVAFSDGYVQGEEGAHPELTEYAKQRGIPAFDYPGLEDISNKYGDIYDQVFSAGEE